MVKQCFIGKGTLMVVMSFVPLLAWTQSEKAPGDALFAMLEPLVGKHFKATFPNSTTVDEQFYKAVYGGAFIRNTHQVKNEAGSVLYEGETIFARNPQDGTVVFWYWNTTGGYVTGTLVLEGERIMVTGKNHGPANQTPQVKSSMWDISPKSYRANSYFLKDGAWVEQWTMTYVEFEPNP